VGEGSAPNEKQEFPPRCSRRVPAIWLLSSRQKLTRSRRVAHRSCWSGMPGLS